MNKIVFVEDDPEVGTLIAAYLGKHDMDVVVEPRGDRAEEVIAREKPCLLYTSGIEGANNSAQAVGGANRRQTGYPGANDQDVYKRQPLCTSV